MEGSSMAHRNLPRPAAVYGIDIGKNIFHVVGLSCDGTPVQKARFRRDTLLQFFARADPSINASKVVIAYFVSFFFWYGLHWIWSNKLKTSETA